MRVKVTSFAREDLRDGRLFYDAQERGLGRYFSSSVLSDIRSLVNFAGIHPQRHGYYMMVMRRFPYAIYYDKVGTEVSVVAVLDCRRNPQWIVGHLARIS